jgi:hypothetical protein
MPVQAVSYGNFRKYGTVSCRNNAIVQKLAAMNAYGANFGRCVL